MGIVKTACPEPPVIDLTDSEEEDEEIVEVTPPVINESVDGSVLGDVMEDDDSPTAPPAAATKADQRVLGEMTPVRVVTL